MTCVTCDYRDTPTKTCRRFPPFAQTSHIGAPAHAVWPIVADTDYCGEHSGNVAPANTKAGPKKK